MEGFGAGVATIAMCVPATAARCAATMRVLASGDARSAMVKERREGARRMAEDTLQAHCAREPRASPVVWIFPARDAFHRFVDSGYEIGSQATLAARASGQGAACAGASSASPDSWLHPITDDGLAAELTVQGTRCRRDKDHD